MATEKRPGLWANIHAKRKRIAEGSGEKMRRPGSEGAPTAEALRESKTASLAYLAGYENAQVALGLTKVARRQVSYSYGSSYGSPYGSYGYYGGGDPYGYGTQFTTTSTEIDPEIANELEKAQRAWTAMSPEERLRVTDPSGSAVSGGLAGGILGGTLGYGAGHLLGLGGLGRTALTALGATGAGYLGAKGLEARARGEARETEVPLHYSYDLARKELAREALKQLEQSRAAEPKESSGS